MQQKVTEAETEIKRQEDIKRQNERDLKELSRPFQVLCKR